MRRTFLSFILAAASSTIVFGQETRQRTRVSADAESEVSARKDARTLDIASGSRIAAELQNSLDAGRARVGDRVVLKTTEALRSNGRTVVKKGARLLGRVADVQRRAKGSAESSVTLVFDRLESGSLSAPITATINSITQARARANSGDDDFGMDAGASTRTQTRASGGGGGGLLGGATNAVGGIVGSTTQVAGDVAGGVAETTSGAARGVGRTLGQVRVSQSSSAHAEGGSTLSLAGGNLRLEKGATFNLTLSQSANVND